MALRLEGLSVTNPNGLNAGASSSPFPPSSLLPAATVACPRLGPPPHRSLLRPAAAVKAPPPPPVLEEAAGMEGRRKGAGAVVEEGLTQGQQRDMAAAPGV